MTAKKKRVLFAETDPIPIIKKTIRFYFYPDETFHAIQRKEYERTGRRKTENEILNDAFNKHAAEVLGEEDAKKCRMMR